MSESNTQKGPILSVAVRPRNNGDWEKLQRTLSVLVQEGPSIRIKTASADGSTILSGMSELHLELICDRLSREFELELDIDKPTVIYLETVRKRAEAEGKYIRQTGGWGNYGHVKIRVEPNEAEKGFEFIRGYHPIQFARYEATPRRDEFGGDGAGATANKPVGPKAGSGSASVRSYPEME